MGMEQLNCRLALNVAVANVFTLDESTPWSMDADNMAFVSTLECLLVVDEGGNRGRQYSRQTSMILEAVWM